MNPRLRIGPFAFAMALSLAWLPAEAWATGPLAPDDAAAAIFAVAAPSCLQSPEPELAAKKPYGFPNKADCYAQCGGGVTLECKGTPWCNSADRNCASGEPGHCTDANGTKTCSPGCGCTSTAYCWDGSTRTCNGTSPGSCSATDSQCSWLIQGGCSSNTESKSCPTCPTTCTASAHCNFDPGVQCSGNTCSERQGCWVNCDGFVTYCPGQGPGCLEN